MDEAKVVGIFVAPREGAPVEPLEEVRAVPGRGLEGDRYYGRPDGELEPGQEITLITSEGLAQARTEHGLELAPGEHRRNVVTRGVDLLKCVGKEMTLGEVTIEVMRDNPPCRYLAKLTGKPVVKALIEHGGVRGRILTAGAIRVGDAVAG